MVINDEAHHAYRRGTADSEDKYALDDETAEAERIFREGMRHELAFWG